MDAVTFVGGRRFDSAIRTAFRIVNNNKNVHLDELNEVCKHQEMSYSIFWLYLVLTHVPYSIRSTEGENATNGLMVHASIAVLDSENIRKSRF